MPAKAIHERGDWCGAWLAQPNTGGTACQIHGRLIHGNFAPESVPEVVLSAHHRREVPLPSGTVAQQYFHLAAAQPGRHLPKPAGLQVRQPPPALPWAEARSKRPQSQHIIASSDQSPAQGVHHSPMRPSISPYATPTTPSPALT